MNKSSRRQFVRMVGATGAGAMAALGGCDAASEALLTLLAPEPDADFRPPSSAEIDLPAHLLNRLTYGPSPGDYARVAAMGAEAFIDEQLDPEAIGDGRCRRKVASLEPLYEPAAEMYEYDDGQLLSALTANKLLRAVHSRRQLHEVMVEFWTDHFNIVAHKGDCKWLKAADDRDVIRAHALGRFRDLVRASALSPAMLIYLDGHDNKVERPGDRPNENYARELLELHTLGVHGGYTQRDVMEVARCLSGWTYENRPLAFRGAHVEFAPNRHDNGAKSVLGQTIPAAGGAEDLDRVLDIVCAHSSTAIHLATKLCRWFIDDPPPIAAVETVAAAFMEHNGDLKSMLRALFATEAFQNTRGNLLKRPWRFAVSALRAADCDMSRTEPTVEFLRRMGHAPFQYPSPDGYPIEPEPWLGTLLWRWNFALDLARGRVGGAGFSAERLRRAFGDDGALAAHMLGRAPTGLEFETLRGSGQPLALLLASPAFQRH